MTGKHPAEVLQDVSELIQRQRLEHGVQHTVDGPVRPQLRVTSLDPVTYDRYGMLRNRAPQLVGPLVVAGLLVMRREEDALPYALLETGEAENPERYGVAMNPESLENLVDEVVAAQRLINAGRIGHEA